MSMFGMLSAVSCRPRRSIMRRSALRCSADSSAGHRWPVHPGHLWPAELSAEQRSALRRMMDRRGLQLTALNMPNIDINVAGAAAEMRAYSLNLLTETVRLAGELGARGVVIGPGKANPLFPC